MANYLKFLWGEIVLPGIFGGAKALAVDFLAQAKEKMENSLGQ